MPISDFDRLPTFESNKLHNKASNGKLTPARHQHARIRALPAHRDVAAHPLGRDFEGGPETSDIVGLCSTDNSGADVSSVLARCSHDNRTVPRSNSYTKKRHRQKYFGALRHPVELLELPPPPQKKKSRKDLFFSPALRGSGPAPAGIFLPAKAAAGRGEGGREGFRVQGLGFRVWGRWVGGGLPGF